MEFRRGGVEGKERGREREVEMGVCPLGTGIWSPYGLQTPGTESWVGMCTWYESMALDSNMIPSGHGTWEELALVDVRLFKP